MAVPGTVDVEVVPDGCSYATGEVEWGPGAAIVEGLMWHELGHFLELGTGMCPSLGRPAPGVQWLYTSPAGALWLAWPARSGRTKRGSRNS